jgi:hypothetical protein
MLAGFASAQTISISNLPPGNSEVSVQSQVPVDLSVRGTTARVSISSILSLGIPGGSIPDSGTTAGVPLQSDGAGKWVKGSVPLIFPLAANRVVPAVTGGRCLHTSTDGLRIEEAAGDCGALSVDQSIVSNNNVLTLDGDSSVPGNNKVYGTDSSGNKGWYNAPSGGGGSEDQVNADWTANSGKAEILNKPNLAPVATTGNYNDLSNKPGIPANTPSVRQTVQSGHPTNLIEKVSNLVARLQASPTYPCIINFAAGADDYKGIITQNMSLPTVTDGRNYFYVQRNPSTGALTTGKTNIRPVYASSIGQAVPAADSFLFSISEMVMYKGDGTNWNPVQVVFLGWAHLVPIAPLDMSAPRQYAFNGVYFSGKFPIAVSTAYSKNHYIGCIPQIVKASGTTSGETWGDFISYISTSNYGVDIGSIDTDMVTLYVGSSRNIRTGTTTHTAAADAEIFASRGW